MRKTKAKRMPLTFEEHVEIASLLRSAREGLTRVFILAANRRTGHRPCHGKRAITHLARTLDHLSIARHSLEEVLCRDHRERFEPEIYYGPER